MPTPKKVKVIVYCGRNLKARKGHGDPLAWVVFGFGKDKRCTKQKRDRAPSWNEESEFVITDAKLPLKFKAKDRDGTLGQVLIPLADLPTDEHCFKWVGLEPYGNNSLTDGEICIDCWVEEMYEDGEEIPKQLAQHSKIKNVIGKLGKGALLGRSSEDLFSKKNNLSISSGGMSMKGSVSMEFLASSHRKNVHELRPEIIRKDASYHSPMINVVEHGRTPSPLMSRSRNELPTVQELSSPPEIEMVTPNRGPLSGGTLVQISGQNLGKSARDIITLKIGSADCLGSLEYYSVNKLMCTTPAGEGLCPIILTTKSGGTCTSKVKYHFRRSEEKQVEANPEKEKASLEPSKGMIAFRRESMVEMATEETLNIQTDDTMYYNAERDDKNQNISSDEDPKAGFSEVEKLKIQIQSLEEQNKELRSYLDRLVVYLMEKYPDALESRRMYRF